MRILWLSHTAGLGGAELAIVEAAKGLLASGHEVHLVLPSDGPLMKRLQETGVAIHVIPSRFWMHQRQNPPSFVTRFKRVGAHVISARRIRSLAKDVQPDVVVSNTITIPAGALAAKLARLPHVWYIHEFGALDHDTRFDFGEGPSTYYMGALSDRIIVNSKAVQVKLRPRLRELSRLVYYSVEVPDLPPAADRNDQPFTAILSGRMVPGKRQEDAVRAVATLAGAGVPIRLLLLGNDEGEYGRRILRLVEELGLRDCVEVLPFVDQPHTVMQRADLALMCSVSEAFGRVTVEAMKLGLPVVGANSEGTAELIRDGWNGLLYEPCDVADLASKIRRLYLNRRLLRTLAGHARIWANETFVQEKFTMGLVQVFTEAIGASGHAGSGGAA